MLELIAIILSCVAIVLMLIGLVCVAKIAKKGTQSGALSNSPQLEEVIKSETRDLKTALSAQQTASQSAVYAGVQQTNEQVLGRVKDLGKENADKIELMRQELSKSLSEIRGEIRQTLTHVQDSLGKSLTEVRTDNAKQLEEMRKVVDEKLSTTLNERLGQSFLAVSERLEALNKGLGEMQALSGGISDLTKTLSNVKTRGGWAEVSLEGILDDVIPKLYDKQVCVNSKKGDRSRVDFAVRLPSSDDEVLLLPIDVKFPVEDYIRMGDALASGNNEDYIESAKGFQQAIKKEARSIAEKYINPPITTDYAVMYLPTEGLYGELLRQGGLAEQIQREFHVIPAGPTNIIAMLNTVRISIRNINMQKHSKEVFQILKSFQKEFEKFSGIVERAQNQIETVSKSLGDAGKRTDIINKKLKKIELLDVYDEGGDTVPPLIGDGEQDG